MYRFKSSAHAKLASSYHHYKQFVSPWNRTLDIAPLSGPNFLSQALYRQYNYHLQHSSLKITWSFTAEKPWTSYCTGTLHERGPRSPCHPRGLCPPRWMGPWLRGTLGRVRSFPTWVSLSNLLFTVISLLIYWIQY